MSWREAPPVERARYHAARLAAWARRTRPAALAVRGAVWSSGFVAVLLVAVPLIDPGPAVVAAALLAALGAGFPRSGWVGGLEVAVVLVVAGAVWLGQPVPIGTVAILAALLYLHHSAAALAAHLRTDALVSPAVLRRWAGRTAAVLAGSLVIGAGAVTVPQTAPGWSASGLMAVAAAATVLIAGTIAYLGRAHRGSRPR
jgi:hypothetical protein